MNKGLPLISIIVPVYNVERYLERCLDSILNQTYSQLEIIIVDDGSTDNSGIICDEYRKKDKRVKVIHKLNGGQSIARNIGINEACGKYISFVDSDDWVTSDYIDSMYRLLMENDCDIAICGSRKVTGKEIKEKNIKEKRKVYFRDEAVEQLLYQRISTSVYGKLFAKYLWDGIRFPVGKIYEEIEPLYLLLKKSTRVVATNICKYNYFYRHESTVNQKFSIRKMDYMENCRKVLECVEEDYPQYERAAVSRLVWAEIHILVHMDNPQNYPIQYSMLMQDIKKYRWLVLKDKQNKLTTRVVTGLSFMGYRALKVIYNISM